MRSDARLGRLSHDAGGRHASRDAFGARAHGHHRADRRSHPEGRNFVAPAGNRSIDIEPERLISRSTRMRVAAGHGWIFRDRAPAGEIIARTEHSVDLLTAITRKEK